MDEGERIKWQQAEVDARRAAFLSHLEYCTSCRIGPQSTIGRRTTCPELVPILRAYDQAQAFLAELLLPILRSPASSTRARSSPDLKRTTPCHWPSTTRRCRGGQSTAIIEDHPAA